MKYTHRAPYLPAKPFSPLRLQSRILLLIAAVPLLLLSTQSHTFAGSATWSESPATGEWNTASNWVPATVPHQIGDIATFANSNVTDVSLSSAGFLQFALNGIVFDAGASPFTITLDPIVFLNINGAGITNNSGITQNFVTAGGSMQFVNTGSAGDAIYTLNRGGIIFDGAAVTAGNGTFTINGGATHHAKGASIVFYHGATAGNASFTNNPGTAGRAKGGRVAFQGTAGNGTFINNGSGAEDPFPKSAGRTDFGFNSTASNATIINNGATASDGEGGVTSFYRRSQAGNATLIANGGVNGGPGGSIRFFSHSAGGTPRVELFGNGVLDVRSHGVTVGSIEGDGLIFLGNKNLTVGSNKLSTTFSGVIQDGEFFAGGPLTKIGKGTLTLAGSNTYTGGTILRAGTTLLVSNTTGSGTGTGPVQVNGGKLGGKGTIAGDVTIGNGSGRRSVLSPGRGAVTRGTLTIQSTLTFNSDATYNFWLNSNDTTADEVVALGVTINNGAQFSFGDLGSSTVPLGTVFTVINNTAATPIAGVFSNLPDGSTFTSIANSYQVNYEGGGGNDLTLTVVP